MQRLREQVPYDPANEPKFSSPDNLPSRCSLPSPQMMQELVKVLVVDLCCGWRNLLTRRIQQRSAKQFSDPPVHIGGETCGGRQNLHSGETSSTILVGGGTCGVPPSSFPRLISSAMSPAPVQNSVFQFSAPQELEEILKEFSENRAFPSIIIIILPVPLMMQERSRRKSGHFQLHR